MNNSERVVYTLADILGEKLPPSEAEALLQKDKDTYTLYQNFPPEWKEALLDLIKGERGLRITYDSFFKKIMNPEEHPERMEDFLSSILDEPVQIKAVKRKEGIQLAAEGGFVVMDMVAVMQNGAIMNVEIQKVGYAFPGERSSCYLSDLTMRQYSEKKLEKRAKKKKFNFRDLKPVYLIVLMEDSPATFQKMFPEYIHYGKITFNTNLPIEHLQRVVYISLDTFQQTIQNKKGKLTKREAWLMFLSCADPEKIVQLVNMYPEFLACYKEMAVFRKNPKEAIFMFSEELAIMDRNLALYMIEEKEKELKRMNRKLEFRRQKMESLDKEIESLDKEIESKDKEIESKDKEIESRDKEIESKDKEIESLDKEIESKDKEIESKDKEIESKDKEIESMNKRIRELEAALEAKNA